MTQYRALALKPDGSAEWTNIEAGSIEEVAARLTATGAAPIDIRLGAPSLLERLNQPIATSTAIRQAELTLVTEQLVALLEAGLPLEGALEMLSAQASAKATRRTLDSLLAAIRSGSTFADALAATRGVPASYAGVVQAAERGGRLREGLADLAATMREAATFRGQLVSALLYPAIVLLTTIGALIVVLTGVVPQFEPIFAGEEHRLPLLTRAVLALSRLVTGDWPWLLLLLATMTALIWRMRRSPWLAARLYRLPGAALAQKYSAARLLRVLGSMLRNGVPLAEALELAARSVGRLGHARLATAASQQVREGAALSQALGRAAGFPPAALRLLEIGEQSGRLAEMSLRAAALLEAETRTRIERLVAVANPLAIMLLGGLVALLIMGVMLGIFSLNDFVG